MSNMKGNPDQVGSNGSQGNGHIDKESNAFPTRSAIRALIQDFSPVWFTWCMNTGIISILLHTLPYQFDGQKIISTILYTVDLSLFAVFSIIMILRLAIYRSTALHEIASDVNELCFMGTWVISWMTLVSLTGVIVSNSYWGGYTFTIVAVVMWWMSVAWTFFTAHIVYIILAQKELTAAKNLSLAIILPAVATATTAAEGGLLTIYSYHLSARLAVPIIIVSYLMLGVGFFIALLIYALFLQRILVTGWFDGVRRPSLCLLLGPTGQTATALLGLAQTSKMHFGEYGRGTFLQDSAATALHGGSVLLALLVFGFGIFWMIFAVYGILDAVVRKEAKWTPAWYSTIFPTGTMNSAMIFLSREMDSQTFRVLAAVLLIILVLSLLINLCFTIRGVAQGQVLVVREDPRLKKQS